MDPLAARPPRPFTGRSQIAVELALVAYAAVCAVVVVRLVLLALQIDHRLWIGSTFYRFTDPVADALSRLPGANRALIGDITLPDLTLAALVALVPLAIVARGRRRAST